MIQEPAASDGPQEHADWLELFALLSNDRNSSFQDLVSVIRRSGSYDALAYETLDRGSEDSQRLADDAMSEIGNRAAACGDGYPFDVADQYISLRGQEWESSPYVFMLLLRHLGVSAGPVEVRAASHFEELATEAARRYLGGDDGGAEAMHFGFPRRVGPGGFAAAVTDLCNRLGEGGGPNLERARRLADQKDAKLDLVAWRSFPDARRGKLVAFGQCAAGDNYDAKVSELRPRTFTSLWMTEHVWPAPLLFFFVPLCVDDDEWIEMLATDAIIFDRCRISALLAESPLPAELAARTDKWCQDVLDSLSRQP